ncbi:hypothetical protein HYPSUDRAFT_1041062 [Hypholoma sublateritium FD-334 SS-4]|uniref:Uncharacterized protein n=1 Tax=Hypholoma sublateritium (strain FD-334 SS-4) TaxID=945553 RepID=A0A0D2NDV0_HYPSF|nr:hypothetical protein HYPSUDRAFT_1041062 [Hypholoma sublateritium FD-334 SS-4]
MGFCYLFYLCFAGRRWSALVCSYTLYFFVVCMRPRVCRDACAARNARHASHTPNTRRAPARDLVFLASQIDRDPYSHSGHQTPPACLTSDSGHLALPPPSLPPPPQAPGARRTGQRSIMCSRRPRPIELGANGRCAPRRPLGLSTCCVTANCARPSILLRTHRRALRAPVSRPAAARRTPGVGMRRVSRAVRISRRLRPCNTDTPGAYLPRREYLQSPAPMSL